MPSRRSIIATAGAACIAMSSRANAQAYPSRLVTMVVPAPAGSTPDLLARLVAERLRPALGQDVIVENKPGAGGIIGAELVARAPADGHTLLCATEWVFFSHLLHSKLAFNPQAFEPVSVLARYPLILIGRHNLPFATVAELVAHARARPGSLTYASSGSGSMHQLVYEGIKKRAQVDLVHVPYRGGPLAMNDLLAGHVDVSLTSLNQGVPHIRSGRLKLLGVVSQTRLAEFPDTPALSEVVPGLEADAWTGIAAPPQTPRDIVGKLAAAIGQAIQAPDVRARLLETMLLPVGSTPEEMKSAMVADVQRWAPVIAAARIAVD
jgi:tripartite-type tricarboxylate transporter receptor subunit TctC